MSLPIAAKRPTLPVMKESPRFRWRWLVWLLIPLLLAWALRGVPLAHIWETLRGLRLWQIGLLLLLDLGIMLSFSGRWWVILLAQGHPVPYLALSSYRLAAFGVSYFTPGPQFGGEPLQVYALIHRHRLPGPSTAASVALEKLLELVVNFSFVSLGVLLTLQTQVFDGLPLWQALTLTLILSALPISYLIATWRGAHPLSWLLLRLPARLRDTPRFQDAYRNIRESEVQAQALIRAAPYSLVLALLISILSWGGQMLSYWLACHFLGVNLALLELVSVMTAGYSSLLVPLPGGLGAFEAGQAWIMAQLGYPAALGISLALLLRARDLLFGGVGLWLSGIIIGK